MRAISCGTERLPGNSGSSAPAGFCLWHGLGPHFGLKDAGGRVSIPTAYGCLIATIVAAALMAIFGGE
jgi:hypothetical protein